MGSQGRDDLWKAMDSRTQEDSIPKETGDGPVKKNRPPKKFREVPEYYFLPRRSLPYNIAFFGSCIATGIALGFVMNWYMAKKVKEDSKILELDDES